ncbi:MAG: hypothetical protein AB1609_03345 [Bacillota bacterium]
MPTTELDELIRGFSKTATAWVSNAPDHQGIRGFTSHQVEARMGREIREGPPLAEVIAKYARI